MAITGDIKSRKFVRILKKLCVTYGLELKGGGNHPYRVCYPGSYPYPIPSGHKLINTNIVRDFGKWLERNGICTRVEYENLCTSL